MIYVQKMGGKPVPPVERQKLYVPILWGQSNIDGRVSVTELPSDVVNPSTKVNIYINGGWKNWDSTSPPEMNTSSQAYGPDTLLLNRLADLLGEDTYAIKNSAGGTTVFQSTGGKGDWNVNSTESVDHYPELVKRFNNTKNYVENVLDMDLVVPYIWMDIGENDSIVSNTTTAKTDYKAIFSAIRGLTGNPDTPIIHRELGLYQGGVTQWYIDMQNDFANGEVNNYTLIPNTGFTLFDTYHLDAASVDDYANQVLEIVKHYYPSYTE